MALSDPQSVTISGTAISLPRTGMGPNSGTFGSSDGTTAESVSHQYGKRIRRVIRIDTSKVAPDPLISAQNIKHSMAAYVVFDVPVTGYTVAEAKAVWDGFAAQLAASSGALVTKVLGGEI